MTASKMNPSIDIPAHLISLAKANTEVQVLWLYGSMALWLYGSMALWLPV
ncbi:hypothetical protein [Azomonas agilis]|nr:hypothetical protein [Azomonas agilis]